MFRPPVVRYFCSTMNSHHIPQDILETVLHHTAASLHRIALKAPYVGQKRRAEQFARRVRLPRFSLTAVDRIAGSFRPMMEHRQAA